MLHCSSTNQSQIYLDTLELENQCSFLNHDVNVGNHIHLFNQYNSSFANPIKGFPMHNWQVSDLFLFSASLFYCHLP